MHCPYCGNKLEPDHRFCALCGKPARTPEPPATEIPQQTQISEPTSPAPQASPSQLPLHPIPDGFLLDTNSGMYYQSVNLLDGQGRPIQRVTYFDQKSGIYQTADYPLVSVQNCYIPEKENKKNKKIVVIITLSILLLIGVLVGILYYVKTILPKNEKTPPINGSSSNSQSWRDYKSNHSEEEVPPPRTKYDDQPKTSKEEVPVIPKIKLSPLEDKSVDRHKVIHDSSFTGPIYEQGDYYYVLTLKGEEITRTIQVPDKEEKSGYHTESIISPTSNANTVYRLEKSTGKMEPLISAADGYYISEIAVCGDYLFYLCGMTDQEKFPMHEYGELYYISLTEKDAKPTLLIDMDLGAMTVSNGYLYFLGTNQEKFYKIGVTESGKVGYNATPIQFDFPIYTYHMSSLAMKENKFYFTIFEYGNRTQQTGYYDLDTKKAEILFRGEPESMYRNHIMTDDKIFFVKYDGSNPGYQKVSLGYRPLKSTDSKEEVILSEKTVQWVDSGLFLYCYNDKLYYEKDGAILEAPLDDLENTTLITQIPPNFEVAVAINDIVIFENDVMVHITTGETIPLEYEEKDPVLAKDITLDGFGISR